MFCEIISGDREALAPRDSIAFGPLRKHKKLALGPAKVAAFMNFEYRPLQVFS